MAIPYYHVDSFTDELFAGNPAGVCILSAFLPDGVMQKIAAENRHSETAFVVRRVDGDFDLRWFTPTVEDDLCGHATLASAFVLALRKHDVWPVRFHTCSGMLTVAQEKDSFAMDFPARPAEPCETPAELLPALGLQAALVMKSRDYLVVVDEAEQVRTLKPNIAALAEVEAGRGRGGLRVPVVCAGGGDRRGSCDGVDPLHAGSLLGGAAGEGNAACETAERAGWEHGEQNLRQPRQDCREGAVIPSGHAETLGFHS